MKKTNKDKKVILLHIDPKIHEVLDRLARSKASRLKPYVEMKLTEMATEYLNQKLQESFKNSMHTQGLSKN